MSVKIISIETASRLAENGIKTGDELLSINGHPVNDLLDFYYYSPVKKVRFKFRAQDKKEILLPFRNPFYSSNFGFEIEDIKPRRCNCNCIFCFVSQQPKGLRRQLYVKDEDYRLSFLYGNYITCTNLSEEDLKRIVKLRLSPLYISVHTTNGELRKSMLGRKKLPPIMKTLKFFKTKNIAFHTQIVLCPGINDGSELNQTISDLIELYPALKSIAIVPVGLTKHRKELTKLKGVDSKYATEFLKAFKKLEKTVREKTGSEVLFASDEFYFLAGKNPPAYSHLEDLPQLENGVGMYADFYRSVKKPLRNLPKNIDKKFRVGVVTSSLGLKAVRRFISRLNTVKNLTVKPIVVENNLFGSSVTVTGLLAGHDITQAIKKKSRCDVYFLPENSLRYGEVFIDDVSLAQLRKTFPSSVFLIGDINQFSLDKMIHNSEHYSNEDRLM